MSRSPRAPSTRATPCCSPARILRPPRETGSPHHGVPCPTPPGTQRWR
jgi:hypothetical protein